MINLMKSPKSQPSEEDKILITVSKLSFVSHPQYICLPIQQFQGETAPHTKIENIL